jgi:hypothetical protein
VQECADDCKVFRVPGNYGTEEYYLKNRLVFMANTERMARKGIDRIIDVSTGMHKPEQFSVRKVSIARKQCFVAHYDENFAFTHISERRSKESRLNISFVKTEEYWTPDWVNGVQLNTKLS